MRYYIRLTPQKSFVIMPLVYHHYHLLLRNLAKIIQFLSSFVVNNSIKSKCIDASMPSSNNSFIFIHLITDNHSPSDFVQPRLDTSWHRLVGGRAPCACAATSWGSRVVPWMQRVFERIGSGVCVNHHMGVSIWVIQIIDTPYLCESKLLILQIIETPDLCESKLLIL